MTSSQKEQMRKLADECGLTKEDFFKHQHYTIMTRQGIEKVAECKKIELHFQCVQAGPDYAAVKCTANTEDLRSVETFGSADMKTSQNKYYLEMAEKRAKARAVLQLTNLYSFGIYSEDESDDFKR